jgi:hypothetical protein
VPVHPLDTVPHLPLQAAACVKGVHVQTLLWQVLGAVHVPVVPQV